VADCRVAAGAAGFNRRRQSPALNRLRGIRLKAWNLPCDPKVITGSGGMNQMDLLSGSQPGSGTLTIFPMGRLWCTLTDFDRKR
jgi:hypothetical protein